MVFPKRGEKIEFVFNQSNVQVSCLVVHDQIVGTKKERKKALRKIYFVSNFLSKKEEYSKTTQDSIKLCK